jgi:hypothetical protein
MGEARTSRLEEDVGEVKAAIVCLEPLINRIAGGLSACDQVAIRWPQRQCSTFGPLGQSRH